LRGEKGQRGRTYAAESHVIQQRKHAAKRGQVIAGCRQQQRSSTASILLPQPANSRVNASFFLGLLPQYDAVVYPMNPVIEGSEVRALVSQMDERPDAAAFVYSYAAVTLFLTRTVPVDQTPTDRERIAAFVARSVEHHRSPGMDSQPSIVDVMTDIFVQICFIGLRRLELGFLYLRQAISLLYLLK
ncbi:hypothetical protein MPDQ_006347, partial [Monascus purpureus]